MQDPAAVWISEEDIKSFLENDGAWPGACVVTNVRGTRPGIAIRRGHMHDAIIAVTILEVGMEDSVERHNRRWIRSIGDEVCVAEAPTASRPHSPHDSLSFVVDRKDAENVVV